MTTLSAGNHPHITAKYVSDGNYLTSTSSDIDNVVSQDDTTTSVSDDNETSVYGQTVTFTATVTASSPGSGTPTGTVDFYYDGSALLGSGTLSVVDGADVATFITSTLAVGDYPNITAGYLGDTNFVTSASTPSFDQVVNQADLTVTAADVTMTYADGTTLNGTMGFSASGLQNGETIGAVTLTTSASTSSSGNWDAGAWTITPSAAVGETFDPTNYAISYVGGTLTVNQKSVTISGLSAQDKTYDTTPTATLTGTPSIASGGVVSGDSVGVSGSATGSFVSTRAG